MNILEDTVKMNYCDAFVYAMGLQTLITFAPLYLFSFLAMFYFMVRSRIRFYTNLDSLVMLYIVAGVISFIVNFIPTILDLGRYHPTAPLNYIKSFVVFLTAFTYFGGYRFDVKSFAIISFIVIVPSALSIFLGIDADAIFISNTRGGSSSPLVAGWPHKWVIFVLIGYFYFLTYALETQKLWQYAVTGAFLTLIMISGTRSALIGLVIGHFPFIARSKKLAIVSIIILIGIGAIFYIYYDQLQGLFRFADTVQMVDGSNDGGDKESSLALRVNGLWPAIIESISGWRLALGWGHIGVSFIPYSFFSSLSEFLYGNASCESQYFDVLQRQGFVGLILYMSIVISGIIYANRMVRMTKGSRICAFWLGSVAWQIGAMCQGVTTETMRLPFYALFYLLFLGMLSNQYRLARDNALK